MYQLDLHRGIYKLSKLFMFCNHVLAFSSAGYEVAKLVYTNKLASLTLQPKN